MRNTKKPPNGPGKNRAVVATTVDLKTSAEIDRLAAAGGLTRSQWAREALTEAALEASIYSITKNIQVTKLAGKASTQDTAINVITPSTNSVGGFSTATQSNSRQAG
jgi:hypothetical protein